MRTSVRGAPALIFAVGLTLATPLAMAAAGQLDPSFGSSGTTVLNANATYYIYPNWIEFQPDNKILVAGYGSNSPSDFVYRFNANGALDTGFGTMGRIAPDTLNTSGVAVQADGKMVVVGGGATMDVFRYNRDGSPDKAFG